MANVYQISDVIETTYDCSILDSITPKLRYEFLRHFRRREAYCTSIKPVLARLINNYYDKTKRKPKVKFIGGPKNLTVHWSPKYNKLIYIFGEVHEETTNCFLKFPESKVRESNNIAHIEDYMIDLYKNTDKFIDFFAEFPAFGIGNYNYSNTSSNYMPYENPQCRLSKLFRQFKTCLVTDTRHADRCQLGRVHFFDVRFFNYAAMDNISNLMYLFRISFNDGKKIDGVLKNVIIIQTLDFLQNIFCGRSSNRAKRFFYAHILGNPYNVRELSKLETFSLYLSEELKDFIKDEIDESVHTFYDVFKTNIPLLADYNKWCTQLTVAPQNIIESFNKISGCFINIVTILPDMYNLARMFRKYNLGKPGFQGALRNDQPAEAHNIVVYAGDQHSQRCRRFLNRLDFEEIDKTGQAENSDDTCINMKSIRQPFFSIDSDIPMKIPEGLEYDFNYDFKYDVGAPKWDPMKGVTY